MTALKITYALNVWNTYQEVLLNCEILKRLNEESESFEEVHCISLGGYLEPPTPEQAIHSTHYHISTPSFAEGRSVKFQSLYRVLEGFKKAYHIALERGSDFAVVTNSDAWILDAGKLHRLLLSKEMQEAAIGCRIGELTGLSISMGPRLPQIDDHFLIINVNVCRRLGVFDYDHDVKLYHSKFEHIGGIHNVLGLFFCARVPTGKLHIYSHAESALGQYGDFSGWNLLPWQLEPDTGFLHANCAQLNELHYLRAELMRQLKLDRFEKIASYCHSFPKEKAPYEIVIRRGYPARKRPFKRWIFDHGFFTIQRVGWVLQKPFFKMSREHKTLFWKNFKIYPNRLLG